MTQTARTIRTVVTDDTDRGYGPVRYTPIYMPRYDNSYQYHTHHITLTVTVTCDTF